MAVRWQPAARVLGIAGCLLAGAAGLRPEAARAHAPPQVKRILWREPGQGVLLVTNRGLIYGTPGGDDWRLLCNDALGVNVYDTPSVAYLQDGRLLAATVAGLKATSDDGCTLQGVAELGELQATAMEVDPSAPQRIFVTCYGTGQSGVWLSEDGSASFTRVMEAEDNDFVRALKVAPGDPLNVYVSGSTFDQEG